MLWKNASDRVIHCLLFMQYDPYPYFLLPAAWSFAKIRLIKSTLPLETPSAKLKAIGIMKPWCSKTLNTSPFVVEPHQQFWYEWHHLSRSIEHKPKKQKCQVITHTWFILKKKNIFVFALNSVLLLSSSRKSIFFWHITSLLTYRVYKYTFSVYLVKDYGPQRPEKLLICIFWTPLCHFH